jgi:hypothetical protein
MVGMDKKYALYVVIVGIVAILLSPVATALALGLFPAVSKDTIVSISGPATAAISAIAAAFFGITVGAAGKAESDQEAKKEGKKAAASKAVALSSAGQTLTTQQVESLIASAIQTN